MFQLIQFPAEALPDIRELLRLSVDQLMTLSELLNSKEAAPPVDQSFEDRARETLAIDANCAEAVVRISLILQGTNLNHEKALKVVEDFGQLIRREKPTDQDDLLKQIQEKHDFLINVLIRKPVISREIQRRHIASGTQPALESFRTLVQLRPLFERDDKGKAIGIECLIPAMTLELKYERDDRAHSATFSLTEETLNELIESLEDARSKWAILKQKFSDQMCD